MFLISSSKLDHIILFQHILAFWAFAAVVVIQSKSEVQQRNKFIELQAAGNKKYIQSNKKQKKLDNYCNDRGGKSQWGEVDVRYFLWDFQKWQKVTPPYLGSGRVERWPDWCEGKDSQAADSWQI